MGIVVNLSQIHFETWEKVLALFYVLPALFMAVRALVRTKNNAILKFSSKMGCAVWLMSFVRDLVATPAFIIFAGYMFYKNIRFISTSFFVLCGVVVVVIAYSVLVRFYVRWVYRQMSLYLECDAHRDEKYFFERFYSYFSFIGDARDVSVQTPKLEHGKDIASKISVRPTLLGALDTFIICKVGLAAVKWRGNEFVSHIYNNIASVWAQRALSLSRTTLDIQGLEHLAELQGKVVFAFGHKSFFDLVLGTFISTLAKPADRERFSLKYLAARDHFKKNIFLYRLLGLGRIMEALGMIFVERRGDKESAQRSVDAAVDAMCNSGADIALYPQGTRARPYRGTSGERLDAGYYTSGSKERLGKECGHIKKGAAHIVSSCAEKLPKEEHIYIVPIAIKGSATVVPKGSVKIKTGETVKVMIGEPISVRNVLNFSGQERAVETLTVALDNSLKDLLEIHSELENRFFRDIRAWSTNLNLEYIAVAMKAHRGEDYLVYTILDCIYSLPCALWSDGLNELCQLFLNDSDREHFVELKKKIVSQFKG